MKIEIKLTLAIPRNVENPDIELNSDPTHNYCPTENYTFLINLLSGVKNKQICHLRLNWIYTVDILSGLYLLFANIFDTSVNIWLHRVWPLKRCLRDYYSFKLYQSFDGLYRRRNGMSIFEKTLWTVFHLSPLVFEENFAVFRVVSSSFFVVYKIYIYIILCMV